MRQARPQGPLQTLSSAAIVAPPVPRDVPATDPERRLKETIDGGERPGGVYISKAGPGADAACAAWVWRLWTGGFQLPGCAHVDKSPTTHLEYGQAEVTTTTQTISVRVGIDVDRMRAICRGADPNEAIDWLGKAFETLASSLQLDSARIERARALLHEGGIHFEVPLIRATAGDAELVAYVALRPKGAHEIVLEHRAAGVIRRGPVAVRDVHPLWAGELKLVNGVVQLAPQKKSMGPPLKLAVKKMTPA